MRWIVFCVVTLLLISSLATAAVPQDTPHIKVTLLSQSPDPSEPGEIVVLKFKIENEGKETYEDVIINLLPQFPFSLYGDSAKKNVGTLPASSTGADAAIVEYSIKIDEDAVEKETEIELEIIRGENAIKFTDNQFLVDIETRDAVLQLQNIKTTPTKISPGETAKISFLAKNLADSLLKDATFKLEISGSSLPFAPYQSSATKVVPQLKSGYQHPISFDIIVDPSAAGGLYKVPLNVSYIDEQGNSYVKEETLALQVGKTPSIKPFIKKTTVMKAKKKGTITLGIANAGVTNIKLLELEVRPSENFILLSPSNYFYIGDVDSDDTESEEIDIFINNDVETLSIPISLKYYDVNNNLFQEDVELPLNLYSSSQLKKFGVEVRNYTPLYILIIILAGVGYWYYRRRKKQENDN